MAASMVAVEAVDVEDADDELVLVPSASPHLRPLPADRHPAAPLHGPLHGTDAAQLFSDSEVSDEGELEAAKARAAADSLDQERAQTACELCQGSLGARPLRLAACRHALCECCVLRTVYVLSECPICDAPVKRPGRRHVGTPANDAESVTPQPSASEAELEYADAAAARARAAADAALILEYGNEATPAAGAKTMYKTFVRVLQANDGGAIKRVTFNINPSFERPTATVDRPKTKRLGFTFEYAMVRPYPCFMRVEFADGGAPLSIEYRVSDAKAGERRIARRIAIDPRKLKGQKPQGQARQNQEKGRGHHHRSLRGGSECVG